MMGSVTRMSPNQPKTPVRSLRVDDETWDQVRAAARAAGVTVTDWVVAAVRAQLAADTDRRTGQDRPEEERP